MARTAVEGFVSGLHRSFYHGFGSEFFQYRSYVPGDDLKYVDWKVYSRHNRFYTKLFEEQTNMDISLVLDNSASMDYKGSSAPCPKWKYAAMIAAALAYLAKRQGDNFGLYIYNDKLREGVAASNRVGHFQRVLAALMRSKPSGQAKHEVAFDYLFRSLRRRGIVVLISDMLESRDTLPPLLKRMQTAGCECLAVQVLDSDELTLPFEKTTQFIGLEDGVRILTNPASIRADYIQAMEAYQSQLKLAIINAEVGYLQCVSSESLGNSLAAYLHQRESMKGR